MLTNAIQMTPMSVSVEATSNGGSPPEFWAKLAADRIVHVADSAPAPIRDQAIAFRDNVEKTILRYMKNAIESDRTTVCYLVDQAGQPELSKLLRRS